MELHRIFICCGLEQRQRRRPLEKPAKQMRPDADESRDEPYFDHEGRRSVQLALALVFVLAGGDCSRPAACTACESASLNAINQQLSGTLIDYTNNHGCDNRIFSEILAQPRDLYVYLPPGYSPDKAYPLLMWFHGAFGDEHSILADYVLLLLDRLIASGTVPPLIFACPDGTFEGTRGLFTHHSFYVNGPGGRFEDHVMMEVVPFVETHYSVRPEREAHVFGGVSAGGFAAVGLTLKYRHQFHASGTLAAPVNMRLSNDKGKYFKNFNPKSYRWRDDYRPKEVVGCFFGVVKLRSRRLIEHAFGPADEVLENVRLNNPADLLFALDVQPGEVQIYLNYPGCDNFNFDAQSESFEWLARCRGMNVVMSKDKHARHLTPYFSRNAASLFYWLGQQVLPPVELTSSQLVVEPEE